MFWQDSETFGDRMALFTAKGSKLGLLKKNAKIVIEFESTVGMMMPIGLMEPIRFVVNYSSTEKGNLTCIMLKN